MDLYMKQHIGRQQHRQRKQDPEIPPIASGDDLDGGGRGNGEQKRAIDRGGGNRANPCGAKDGKPPGQPCQYEPEQGQALHRQAACPIGNRGQQEPRRDGGKVAEQHLVDVPVHGCEQAMGLELAT